MAVPVEGSLTLLAIAQERKFGTYGSGDIQQSVDLAGLLLTGGANGYPALNQNSPAKPNTSTPHAMNEWYGYDQDAAAPVACDRIELSYTSRYRSATDACGAEIYLVDGDAKNPFGSKIYALGTDCKEPADSGAYSNGKTAAIWSQKTESWSILSLCGRGGK
tara:strand:- start:213 stop:698 length:486 start_codon:yes stop_codon:yes gene_type:complete